MLNYLSLKDIGVFAVALKFASIFGMLSYALRMAWEPFVYSQIEHKDHRRYFIQIYKVFSVVLCVLLSLVSLFSKELLLILTTAEYSVGANIVAILSLSFVMHILSELVGIGPKIVKKTIYLSHSHFISFAVSVIAMFILIPRWGIVGASIAICLSGGVVLLFSWYYTEKFYTIGYPKLFTVLMISAIISVIIITNIFTISLEIKIVIALMCICTLIYHYKHIRRLLTI